MAIPCPAPVPYRDRPRCRFALLLVLWCGCERGSGRPGGLQPGDTTQPQLQRVDYGRLVDVYGLRPSPDGPIPTLFRRDVVIGADIADQRPDGSELLDAQVQYDFFGTDPATLQPRLLIPRDLDDPAFTRAFDALDDELREVTPMRYGENRPGFPFSVVPRNAALRLSFTAPLGVDDDFFVARDDQGRVRGTRNTEAVQLLRIAGDPEQPNAFEPLPVRIVVREREMVLDPVLLGEEGFAYASANNPAGMPASDDAIGANLRIALALEGPLALPSLREPRNGLLGRDNGARNAVVRDFRSGNRGDVSADLASGFVRDNLPLRLVGDIPMYLERVEAIGDSAQEITVWKGDLVHGIDRGDVFRFVAGTTTEFTGGEVIVEPTDDAIDPATARVRVRIRPIAGLEAIDPSNRPDFPTDELQRPSWLVANAPRAICSAEFRAGGPGGGDDPRNFVSFTPGPLPQNGVQPRPNESLSPFAAAIVRFTKPVDLDSVQWADTFYFAMRDLTDVARREQFVAERPNGTASPGLDPGAFDEAKYRTPFLVAARVIDEDGSQTTLRLQPNSGFYLGGAMRNPAPGADHRYFLHVISASPQGGIRDLAGNALDLQGSTPANASAFVLPFSLDTRRDGGRPLVADNIAVSVVRRFESNDEDSNPSWFRPEEVQPPGLGARAAAAPLDDLFGSYVQIDGRLEGRPTIRTRAIADDRNQAPFVTPTPPPALPNPLAWCPATVSGQAQTGIGTSRVAVGSGIQNPLNPYGCRLQTVWREIDLSLSRTDPADFNLDIEQMYWAPFREGQLSFDEFDRLSLWLGHAEYRPTPCVGATSALPSMPQSGLRNLFERNFLWNPIPSGNGSGVESQAPRTTAYVDAPLVIASVAAVLEPTGTNRFLPLPSFRRPFFVFRDETVMEQGGRGAEAGSDRAPQPYAPHISSPFAMGQGRRTVDVGGLPGNVNFTGSFWNDLPNENLTGGIDNFTGGLVGSIAMPLLADFWTWCDTAELPDGDGYIALGTNGWQTAITTQSNERPNFRVFSGGRGALANGSPPLCRTPADQAWTEAAGGFTLAGAVTPPAPFTGGDNTLYWIMLDLVRRQSVITSGFLDLHNPHRVPEGFADPRLGPFFLENDASTLPDGLLPRLAASFDPPLSRLEAGTSWVAQYRAAGIVDPLPWYWSAWMNGNNALFPNAIYDASMRQQLRPTSINFPLDPRKAGDAHLRKWDTRGGRNWWTYPYNRTVTRYVEEPNDLFDPVFTAQYQGPNEVFTPRDIRYVNWRFVTGNNIDSNPPLSPSIETFALSYRFQPR
ncbi:MAG: hypothetical protein MUC36_20610 [Planctomycetes bacterium]|nr:hypothetical protein [Planctomycetota bacterium]